MAAKHVDPIVAPGREYTNPKQQNTDTGAGSWIDGDLGFDTLAVHGGQKPDPQTGAILSPIVMATTFVQPSIDRYMETGFSYTRSGNPTVADLEKRVCALEGGADCTMYTTGMAATCCAISTFCKKGDHIVITNCSYGGTNRAVRVFFSKFGIEFDFIDMTSVEEVKKYTKPNTTMIFCETPANPTLTLIDLQAVSDFAKEKNIITICDSTFVTPFITKPLDFGMDIVLHSSTKFIDGHNMTVGGALISRTKEIGDMLRFNQNILGSNMSPFVAYLQLQTVKTLSLRITKQSANAQAIAEFLFSHPAVDKVCYPGLEQGFWACEDQKRIAKLQHRNGKHGSMAWFEVKGGSAAGKKLMDTIQRPWALCENLGAVESIITCPSVMTHANMLKEDREKVGITDGFIRVSTGIEEAEDLIAALKAALDNL